jgi:hypothetical protein
MNMEHYKWKDHSAFLRGRPSSLLLQKKGKFIIASKEAESRCYNKVLDVEGAFLQPLARLIIFSEHYAENQLFKISNGIITAAHSGLVLSVKGEVKEGASIVQNVNHGGYKQRWFFPMDGTIQLGNSDLVMGISGGERIDSGVPIVVLARRNGENNQKWIFKPPRYSFD